MASNTPIAVATPKKAPVIFNARGLTIDTRLRVFDTEFHVHSVVLKMHSAFFYKFLDSPEKDNSGPVPFGRFKYEWNTVLCDDKRDWALEALKLGEGIREFDSSGLDRVWVIDEIESFGKLMCAFYGTQYDVASASAVIRLTKLADYYCALPRVSSTIYSALARSCNLKGFWDWRPELLECAYKLRQPELFRDCLYVIAGHWDAKRYAKTLEQIPEPILRKTITSVRNGICAKIAQAQEDIIKLGGRNESFRARMSMPYGTGSHKLSLPYYYRTVSIKEMENVLGFEVTVYSELPSLRSLMHNNTVLLGFTPDSAGNSVKAFLCGEIEDDDLPWDPKQLDW